MEDKRQWGDISTIGITESGMVSIEFYDPAQMDGSDYTTIFLTPEQVTRVSKLGEIICAQGLLKKG
jgi:hypothetical protein